MAYKRAEIVGPGQPFKIVTDEIPVPPPGLVRIKVAYAGVCHSDVHISDDSVGLSKVFGPDNFRGMVLGHETSGYIDAAGQGTDLETLGLKQGDPVMVYPWVGCQNCDSCHSGDSNICPDPTGHENDIGVGPSGKGGYQTHLVTKPQFLVKVPDAISMDVACMLPCSTGTSYAALLKLSNAIKFQQNLGHKPRLLIIGAGGLGLWAIQLAKVMFGADKIHVIAADIGQEKLDLAKQYGADETVLWNKDAEQETTVQDTIKGGKINAAVDFIAIESSSRVVISCLEMNGAVVFVGLRGGNFTAHFFEIVFNQLSIFGSRVFSFPAFKDLIDLVAKNKLSYPALEYYPLEQVYEVIQKLAEGKIRGRAIIKH